MKRIFSAASLWAVLAGCAFTEYGSRINGERAELERLERRRQSYESQYIIVLNGLERHPGDARLEKERDTVRRKIQDLNVRIGEQRDMLDRSVREWEQKIVQDRIQKEMEEREERANVHKDENQWNVTE